MDSCTGAVNYERSPDYPPDVLRRRVARTRRCLYQVSRLLEQTLRKPDRLHRHGSEEFSLALARRLAENLYDAAALHESLQCGRSQHWHCGMLPRK